MYSLLPGKTYLASCVFVYGLFLNLIDTPLLAQSQPPADLPASENAQGPAEIDPTFNACPCPECCAGPCDVSPPPYCGPACRSWTDDLFFNGSIGGSYVDGLDDTYFGGAYDVSANYWLTGLLSATASFSGNHFSRGSQYLGSAGLRKYANPRAAYEFCNPGHNVTWSVLYDYYTDTRFDADITQLRYALGYALSESLEVGAFYWDPLEGDDVAFTLGNITGVIPFQTFETVGGYANIQLEYLSVGASIGYIDEGVHAMVYQLGASQPISDYASVFANGSYQDGPEIWTATTGISFSFGPGNRRNRYYQPGSGYARRDLDDGRFARNPSVQLASADMSTDIVRGQPPGIFGPDPQGVFASIPSNQGVIATDGNLSGFSQLINILVGVATGNSRFADAFLRERQEALNEIAKADAEENARFRAFMQQSNAQDIARNSGNSFKNFRIVGSGMIEGLGMGGEEALVPDPDNPGSFLFTDSDGNRFRCTPNQATGTFFINGEFFDCVPL